MRQVREKEEVAVAVLDLHLRCRDVVVVQVQVGKEEALDVTLALYAVTYRRLVLVAVCHVLEAFTPLAVEGHCVESITQAADSHVSMLVVLKQIRVILLAHIVIRNAQDKTAATRALDGQHPIVEQQAGKYLRVSHFHSRERGV